MAGNSGEQGNKPDIEKKEPQLAELFSHLFPGCNIDDLPKRTLFFIGYMISESLISECEKKVEQEIRRLMREGTYLDSGFAIRFNLPRVFDQTSFDWLTQRATVLSEVPERAEIGDVVNPGETIGHAVEFTWNLLNHPMLENPFTTFIEMLRNDTVPFAVKLVGLSKEIVLKNGARLRAPVAIVYYKEGKRPRKRRESYEKGVTFKLPRDGEPAADGVPAKRTY